MSFSGFLPHFVMAKLSTSSIRVGISINTFGFRVSLKDANLAGEFLYEFVHMVTCRSRVLNKLHGICQRLAVRGCQLKHKQSHSEKTTIEDNNGVLAIIGHKNEILYNWYFYRHLIFRYFHSPHDSAKITSFKKISCFVSLLSAWMPKFKVSLITCKAKF